MNSAKTLMVMAGGTGGHVYPALAVARLLMGQGVKVVWVGNRGKIEDRVAGQAGIPFVPVDVKGVRGNGVLRWLGMPLAVGRSMWQVYRAIRRYRPAAVLGMGGFVTGPGGLMAWLTRTPLLLHEANAIAGMTNRWLSRFADRFMTGFGECEGISRTFEQTGNPVREEICEVGAQRNYESFGPMRLFVFGGSLGAEILNTTIPEALAGMPESERPRVLHQTGRGKYESTLENYHRLGVEADVREFIDDMDAAFSEADLVVSRAGAMTVAEIACAGVASVMVPYPYAVNDHQTANARYLAERGAAVLLPQPEVSPASLVQQFKSLFGDSARLAEMGRTARSLAKRDATNQVAVICKEAMYA